VAALLAVAVLAVPKLLAPVLLRPAAGLQVLLAVGHRRYPLLLAAAQERSLDWVALRCPLWCRPRST